MDDVANGQQHRTGVSATVGGKRIGDAALCTAYARAAVPTCTREEEMSALFVRRCSSEGS